MRENFDYISVPGRQVCKRAHHAVRVPSLRAVTKACRWVVARQVAERLDYQVLQATIRTVLGVLQQTAEKQLHVRLYNVLEIYRVVYY